MKRFESTPCKRRQIMTRYCYIFNCVETETNISYLHRFAIASNESTLYTCDVAWHVRPDLDNVRPNPKLHGHCDRAKF